MSEHPILFSGPMVNAILADRKTQTRRVVKRLNPHYSDPVFDHGKKRWEWETWGGGVMWNRCPFGGPGDTLWVRETWAEFIDEYTTPDDRTILYRADSAAMWQPLAMRADFNPLDHGHKPKWKPSIHMPRQFARITLRVTDVRVEQLQEISEADAKAEGVDAVSMDAVPRQATWTRRQDFSRLWDSINGKRKDKHGKRLPYAWADNPWVWVVEFERVR